MIKTLLKKLLFVLFILFVIGAVVYKYKPQMEAWYYTSACKFPLKYKIGYIDPRFGITEEQFNINIEKAGNIWSTVTEERLFEYDENGKLEISLVYDGRQKLISNISELTTEVDQKSKSIDQITKDYDAKKVQLEKQISKLSNDIEYWNSKGGAPEDVYEELKSRQKKLNEQIEQLNALGSQINSSISLVNNEISDLNSNVESFNSSLEQHPEMGLYTSGEETIEIFFYSSESELVHVIAHELGHALTLDHTEESDALMNPTISANTVLTESDTEQIKNFCGSSTRIDVYKKELYVKLYELKLWLSDKLRPLLSKLAQDSGFNVLK